MTDPQMYYDSHVFVCKNERPEDHPRGCCLHRGSGELHAYMKEKVKKLGVKNARINQSGCLERCEMGPAMVLYPEGVWYTYRNKDDIDEIIQTHMIEGGLVDRLLLLPDDRLPAHREARLAGAAE